ncbi:MAG TPA: SpoIIE family protein phosphatase [Pyrinomonadaceae bacterium]|nr:SpoIIE family protein phosphatase [Pyrinomonadaceae bacterium]
MGKRLQSASGRFAERMSRAREWLRRAMPRVAMASVALYILWLLIRNTEVYKNTPVRFIGLLMACAITTTVLYYGVKILVRLKRMLLWRVRRRLIITYLFVGATPVVLLLLLGALAATGGSSQAMGRVVTVEVGATERHTLEGARALAEALLSLPANANERVAQTWLDERTALLQASLPGARVAAWRGAESEIAHSFHAGAQPQLVSASANEETRGVGFDTGDAREPLPAWLEGQTEWSGLAYIPPPEEKRSGFGTPSVRALVRRTWQGRVAVALVTVPISRALVRRLRETTGIQIRPFFLDAVGDDARQRGRDVQLKIGDGNAARAGANDKDKVVVELNRDQFGELMPEVSPLSFPYPVILQATDWQTGKREAQMAFLVDWSWAEGGKQFWGDAVLGRAWWRGLYILATAFLVLELLALFSAAWMTRAVTGTVHKLYRATGFINRGDFSHRIRTRSRDQLGELTVAFNDMSANIETLLAERVEHERLKREIEIAHEVQAQLFPRSTPAMESAEITGECRAARGVAGDYYDFMEVSPGLVAFTLGDVSGKGLSASLVMSNLQAALRAQVAIVSERQRLAARGANALAGGGTPQASRVATVSDTHRAVAGMTKSINEQLCHSTDTNRFATLFLALYDDRTRTLSYTNAGHNEPLLVRADGSVERLSIGGTIVGAFDFAKFEEAQTTLGDGDMLVLFSDGLSEAQNHTGEEYGERRLAEFVAARRTDTPNNLRQEIFDEVDRWTGAVERGDDQTLVILKAVNRKS